MSSPEEQSICVIGGTRAMTSADPKRASLASRALPLWRSRSTFTEWMGASSP